MRAGLLRHRGAVERRTLTASDEGGYTETWTVLARAQMRIQPIRGREFLESNQMRADITHKIQMRATQQYSITPRDRIVARGRTFQIEAVANVDERDRMIEIMAKEAL